MLLWGGLALARGAREFQRPKAALSRLPNPSHHRRLRLKRRSPSSRSGTGYCDALSLASMDRDEMDVAADGSRVHRAVHTHLSTGLASADLLTQGQCDACRGRKIRCDRGTPCSNCRSSKISMHVPAPLQPYPHCGTEHSGEWHINPFETPFSHTGA
jgi:hypothetical protein